MMRNLRLTQRLTSATKTSLALIGLGTVASLIYNWMEQEKDNRSSNDEQKRRRRVLYLPFHRMKIVEQERTNIFASIQSWITSGRDDSSDDKIEIGLHELIDTIHSAAADKDIVALYGTLGHGFRFQCGGYAHLEEVRDAIRVFNESHRIHEHRALSTGLPKLIKHSYVYTDSFDNPSDPANREYFLASAFSCILMQPRGNLSLFGMTMTTPFLRGFLDKYGIKVHVFKYGKYKTAPNIATEKEFSKEHYENSALLLNSMNRSISSAITFSRRLSTSSSAMWQALYHFGTLSALNAQEIGLVDFLPNINPLDEMVQLNRVEDKEGPKRWLYGMDLDHFQADEVITLGSYRKLLRSRKDRYERRVRIFQWLSYLSAKSSAMESFLSSLGYTFPNFNLSMEECEKTKSNMGDVIAIVYVNGTINDSLAQKTVRALKDIKKRDDVKCVILRINSPGGSAVASEAILEECKTMKRPYLCSFANVAASGGYYIASSAAHIFALDTTVTGSIGVFGVKLDLSHLANNYGINVAHISSGHHGASYSLFSPLSDTISENISRQLKRTYFYFKSLVSLGRKMSLDEVEKIAQGKIWVGKDAQYVGLVDEIGGISRAVAYAQRKYTSGHAIVECWPKAPSLIETGTRLFDSSSSNDGNDYIFNTDPVLRILPCRLQLSDPMLMMIDENSVLQYIVDSS